MHIKLIHKFILIFAVIGIAEFVLISTLGSRLVQHRLVESEGLKLYKEAAKIAQSDVLTNGIDKDSFSSLYLNLHTLAGYQDCEIWLLGSDGTIYMNTAGEPATDDSGDAEYPVLEGFDPLKLGSGYYTVGTFFDYYPEDHLTVLSPVTGNLDIRGYIAIHEPMNNIFTDREEILAIIHLLSIIVYILFLTVFILLYLTVLRPLRKIQTGIQEYADGRLNYNIPVNSHDEMGRLAASLNYMSDELNKSGEYERNFIANVSHDFRSPLTSMKGFVEAILDGTIPPEMQEKYLRIVLAETERLTKLTNGILSLNRIDQKQSKLNLTVFDINEVIRDTAATFEGICTPRQISFDLVLTGEQLLVSADLEKIQQVLYNLIDNAVKFSRDSSSIRIETSIRHGKVHVSVRDHGCGIPASSLNKIWERFYKTDTSRGRERKGNGLGLAIVKEIINLHNQNITVVSTEGVGTEFDFTLEHADDLRTVAQ